MNKYQARNRLIGGHKITHAHFVAGEYLVLFEGRVITEDGCLMGETLYNPWSWAGALEGWEVFELENLEE